MKRLDDERLKKAQYAFSEGAKRKRKDRRMKRKREETQIKKNPKRSGCDGGGF